MMYIILTCIFLLIILNHLILVGLHIFTPLPFYLIILYTVSYILLLFYTDFPSSISICLSIYNIADCGDCYYNLIILIAKLFA